MTRLTNCFAVLWVLFGVAAADAGNIVYLGLDPAHGHIGRIPEVPLIRNAARFAGGSLDPKIGYLEGGGGFGSNTGTKLSMAGFTDITLLAPGDLDTIDLTIYDVLYFGPHTNAAVIDDYQTAAVDILAYVNGSGGLVVEPEIFRANSWSWVPHAGLIGHSGATNVVEDTVVITNPSHPVMAGLTSAGLSNWGGAIHSTFSTPAAAGFEVLATNAFGIPVIIVIPEPTTLSLLTIGSLALIKRKRPAR